MLGELPSLLRRLVRIWGSNPSKSDHCPPAIHRKVHEKTQQLRMNCWVFFSEADGARTRNHRIDSPVL